MKRNRGRRGAGKDGVREGNSSRPLVLEMAGGNRWPSPNGTDGSTRRRRLRDATTRRRGGTQRGGTTSNVGDKGVA